MLSYPLDNYRRLFKQRLNGLFSCLGGGGGELGMPGMKPMKDISKTSRNTRTTVINRTQTTRLQNYSSVRYHSLVLRAIHLRV